MAGLSGAVFNVIGFGSTFTSLFPEPRLYDDETKRLALEHCRGIEADMGGTGAASISFLSSDEQPDSRRDQVTGPS